jgi:hypothetical protein
MPAKKSIKSNSAVFLYLVIKKKLATNTARGMEAILR